jgi:hypothetical protein
LFKKFKNFSRKYYDTDGIVFPKSPDNVKHVQPIPFPTTTVFMAYGNDNMRKENNVHNHGLTPAHMDPSKKLKQLFAKKTCTLQRLPQLPGKDFYSIEGDSFRNHCYSRHIKKPRPLLKPTDVALMTRDGRYIFFSINNPQERLLVSEWSRLVGKCAREVQFDRANLVFGACSLTVGEDGQFSMHLPFKKNIASRPFPPPPSVWEAKINPPSPSSSTASASSFLLQQNTLESDPAIAVSSSSSSPFLDLDTGPDSPLLRLLSTDQETASSSHSFLGSSSSSSSSKLGPATDSGPVFSTLNPATDSGPLIALDSIVAADSGSNSGPATDHNPATVSGSVAAPSKCMY